MCRHLHDPYALCQPSQWADDSLQRALNRSDASLHSLRPEGASRRGARHYDAAVTVVACLLPALAAFLVIHAAYLHVKRYVSSDHYDNAYVTRQVALLDRQAGGPALLPLRPVERRHLVETASPELCAPEDRLYRAGLCVWLLHAALAGVCYGVAGALGWGCGPAPGLGLGLAVAAAYLALLFVTLLKAYVLRGRSHLTSIFYPRTAHRRARALYAHMRARRKLLPTIARETALRNHRQRAALGGVAFCHQVAAHCAPWRVFTHYDGSRCLVCDAAEDTTSHDCHVPHCGATYCAPCFVDLARICAVCGNGRIYEDAGGPQVDYEDVEETALNWTADARTVYL